MPNENKRIQKLFKELITQPLHPFPKAGESLDADIELGVYVIRTRNNRVVHVGRTPRGKNGIYQRLKDHLYCRSSFTYRYLKGKGYKLREEGFRFQYLIVKDDRKRALLEAYATGSLCPAHLGLGD